MNCVIILAFLIASASGYPTQSDEEKNLSKIIGSRVVTSVSVVMNGNETQFTDPIGRPVPRPLVPPQVASPINLLNPDRYEFYTFNESGELIKRLMTKSEIESIVAGGDGDGNMILNNMSSENANSEKNVQDILDTLQNVLSKEMELKSKENKTTPILDTPDVSSSWNLILPAIFGNTGDDITPQKPQQVVMTPDTIVMDTSETTSIRTQTTTEKVPPSFASSSQSIRRRPTKQPIAVTTYKFGNIETDYDDVPIDELKNIPITKVTTLQTTNHPKTTTITTPSKETSLLPSTTSRIVTTTKSSSNPTEVSSLKTESTKTTIKKQTTIPSTIKTTAATTTTTTFIPEAFSATMSTIVLVSTPKTVTHHDNVESSSISTTTSKIKLKTTEKYTTTTTPSTVKTSTTIVPPTTIAQIFLTSDNALLYGSGKNVSSEKEKNSDKTTIIEFNTKDENTSRDEQLLQPVPLFPQSSIAEAESNSISQIIGSLQDDLITDNEGMILATDQILNTENDFITTTEIFDETQEHINTISSESDKIDSLNVFKHEPLFADEPEPILLDITTLEIPTTDTNNFYVEETTEFLTENPMFSSNNEIVETIDKIIAENSKVKPVANIAIIAMKESPFYNPNQTMSEYVEQAATIASVLKTEVQTIKEEEKAITEINNEEEDDNEESNIDDLKESFLNLFSQISDDDYNVIPIKKNASYDRDSNDKFHEFEALSLIAHSTKENSNTDNRDDKIKYETSIVKETSSVSFGVARNPEKEQELQKDQAVSSTEVSIESDVHAIVDSVKIPSEKIKLPNNDFIEFDTLELKSDINHKLNSMENIPTEILGVIGSIDEDLYENTKSNSQDDDEEDASGVEPERDYEELEALPTTTEKIETLTTTEIIEATTKDFIQVPTKTEIQMESVTTESNQELQSDMDLVAQFMQGAQSDLEKEGSNIQDAFHVDLITTTEKVEVSTNNTLTETEITTLFNDITFRTTSDIQSTTEVDNVTTLELMAIKEEPIETRVAVDDAEVLDTIEESELATTMQIPINEDKLETSPVMKETTSDESQYETVPELAITMNIPINEDELETSTVMKKNTSNELDESVPVELTTEDTSSTQEEIDSTTHEIITIDSSNASETTSTETVSVTTILSQMIRETEELTTDSNYSQYESMIPVALINVERKEDSEELIEHKTTTQPSLIEITRIEPEEHDFVKLGETTTMTPENTSKMNDVTEILEKDMASDNKAKTDELTTLSSEHRVESTTAEIEIKISKKPLFSGHTPRPVHSIHKKPILSQFKQNIPHNPSRKPLPVNLNPAPKEALGLEQSTSNLSEDLQDFVKLCNELAFNFWRAMTSEKISSARSLVLSPFAMTSMLAMVFLGARGSTSGEMNEVLRLDDMVTFNPHLVFRNITDSVVNSKDPGVATSAFVRELFSDRTKGKLLQFYKEKAQQFYSGYVEEVNFNAINDVIRRRTNLLVKRNTWGKVLEYLKSNTIFLTPPLAGLSANIFQTDCRNAMVNERDGEMFFQVVPAIRQRRLVPIPAAVWRSGFTAGYDPELDATAVAFGSVHNIVSTIFVMPGQQGHSIPGDSLDRLEYAIVENAINKNAWRRLLTTLMERPGLEVQIPRFSHRSFINATVGLQKMGLKDLFDSGKADLRGLIGSTKGDLYFSDMIQVNQFTTCGEDKVGDQHHIEMYPAPSNREKSLKLDDDVDETDLEHYKSKLYEPQDYQRSFYDPLYDPSLLEIPLPLRPRQARLPEAPRLRFDRPFMYFVRHNPTGMILHMGRFNPRLLP